jgi:hypothetical protein
MLRTAAAALAFSCLTVDAASGQPAAVKKGGAKPDSEIVALERRAWEAIKRKDTTAFFAVAGPDFLYVQPSGVSRVTRAGSADALSGCETRSYGMDSVAVTAAAEGAAVLTYRLTLDQTCGGRLAPTPVYVMEVWARRSGQWVVVSRSETTAQQPSPAR